MLVDGQLILVPKPLECPGDFDPEWNRLFMLLHFSFAESFFANISKARP
tara:strand:- start:192 stop:338 length:147 start_codon:yes stop_codon:yes gene_type:complete